MLQMQWITFVMALLVALIVGGILSRVILKRDGQDRTSLRRQLDELKKQHQGYQISVTEHFSRTSELIEEMNKNYSKIQTHLSRGSEQFINPEYQLESARSGETRLEDLAPEISSENTNITPRDYAPKAPNEEGTLSETYGLKRSELLPEEEKDS